MKITLYAAAGLAALLLTAGAAQAQAQSQSQATPARPTPFDANRDGRLTYEEMRARAHQQFARLDGNRDGRLTRQEAMEAMEARQRLRAERGAGGGRPAADSVLTRDEFRQRADQRFARLDANSDGRLTREEMRAQRMERRAERGRRGMRGGLRLGRMMGLDGEVTLAEIDTVLRQRFDRRDLNNDGALTPDERGGRRGMMRGDRRRMG